MIQAILSGKSPDYENREDILTSTVFGLLKYLKPDMALIPFIESAIIYRENSTTTLLEQLNSEGIELKSYHKVEYIFWTRNQNYGEPDLILIFSDHVDGLEDFLLVIEAKHKSGKSGTGEYDQLLRYFEAINYDIENFTDPSVSGFRGKKGYIIYLTEAEAYSDIMASIKLIQSKHNEITGNIFHLRWHQLYKILEKPDPGFTQYEREIINDLIQYMDKVGLRDYKGIPLPDESLIIALSLPYPVFYYDSKRNNENNTFFDRLWDLNLKVDGCIFYKGESL